MQSFNLKTKNAETAVGPLREGHLTFFASKSSDKDLPGPFEAMLNNFSEHYLCEWSKWAVAFQAARFSTSLANFMRKTTSELYSANKQKKRDQNVKNSESQ